MNALRSGLLVLLITVAGARVSAAAETLGLDEERAFQAAADRVAPGVVRVEAAAAADAAEAAPAGSASTGLVVDPDGWIMTTSFAVPRDLDQAVVLLQPSSSTTAVRVAAKVVARDLSRNLVLLKVAPPFPLTAAAVAVPRADLAVGQWTIAVGRGLKSAVPSIAVGILSATSRAWGRAVQTDASVSPANYGGPLVDIEGRVIGILAPLPADTAGMNMGTELYDSGIGFAVPLEDVQRVLPRLKQGTDLSPGLLGITYRSRDPFTGVPTIATVRAGSPAARAGLRPGDTIVAADGRPVTRIAELRHAIVPRYAGDSLDLVLERPRADDAAERLTVRPTLVAALPPWRRAVLGIVPRRLAAIPRGAEEKPRPVVVEWVWPDSPAAAAGITAGTVVESVTVGDAAERVPIESATALAGVLEGIEVGQEITLTVVDADGTRSARRLATVAMPADVPPAVPTRPETPAEATVVTLEAPEVAAPPLAVLPAGDARDPIGVLVYCGPPHGPVKEEEATVWKQAATRYGVAVVLPGSADPQRWSRSDVSGVARSLDSLAGRRAIDRSRIAMAGTGPGGTFAWMAAESLGPVVRGVALIDAALPRQGRLEPAEPGRARWILFAPGKQTAERAAADRRRLAENGHDVGTLPARDADSTPTETLCAFVEAIGLL